MPKTEHPLHELKKYLPENCLEQVIIYLQQYKVHLTITAQRQSILGDYRNAGFGKNHRISINGNLNKFSFLITLIHELAHLLAFEQYGHRILSHGKEWKNIYSGLLKEFIEKNIFPADVKQALMESVKKPGASSCSETGLTRVLRSYDEHKSNALLLEELPLGSLFKTKDGLIFQKGEKLRKRFKCVEKETGKIYYVSPLYEVKKIG